MWRPCWTAYPLSNPLTLGAEPRDCSKGAPTATSGVSFLHFHLCIPLGGGPLRWAEPTVGQSVPSSPWGQSSSPSLFKVLGLVLIGWLQSHVHPQPITVKLTARRGSLVFWAHCGSSYPSSKQVAEGTGLAWVRFSGEGPKQWEDVDHQGLLSGPASTAPAQRAGNTGWSGLHPGAAP